MFSKDTDEVADLFQEIHINMWKGFSSFRGDSSVSTWIWRISLNTCINTSKKSRRLETIPLNVSISPYEDMTYEEIGAIMGISVKNVSVKLVRIREKLKQMSNNN